MVLAPRHPERFEGVAALLDRSGVRWVQAIGVEGEPAGSAESAAAGRGSAARHHRRTGVGLLAGGGRVRRRQPGAGGRPQSAGTGAIRGSHRDGASLCQLPRHHRRSDRAQCDPDCRARRVGAGPARLARRIGTKAKAMGERARRVFEQQAGATGRCVEAIRGLLLPGIAGAGGIGFCRVGEPGKMIARVRQLLVPFVPLYRMALGFRELRLRRGWEPVRRLRFPVISIGNLSTGGAGKTPFAIALARSAGWSRLCGGRAIARVRPAVSGSGASTGGRFGRGVRGRAAAHCAAGRRSGVCRAGAV